MLLEEPIERAAAALDGFLSSENPDPAFLSAPHEFSENFKLGDVLQIGEAEDDENKTESESDSFEAAVEEQKTSFIVLAALTRVVDSLVLEIQKSEDQVQLGLLPESHLLAICKLCLLLEWQIHSIRAGTYPSTKADFFEVLQLVLELLFTISLSHISRFWDFLELRIGLLKSHLFDKNVTLHRIALLGLCNGLTDKYYVRNSLGKLDSYAKDTFNDEFQARVRMFLASMLSFDDLTGLNKYFAIANRESKEPVVIKTKLSEDNLLRDLVSFQRLLRNPFGYLKSPRLLQNLAGVIEKMAAYLLEQEAKYARKHPERDVYSVEPQQLEDEIAEATEKLKKTVFVPENYWLSLFDAKKDDAVVIEDQNTVLKQLDSLAFRKLLIIHIYLVASFFVELLGPNKMSLLKSTGAPSLKHICDEVTPVESLRIFGNIKRDILRQSRGCDTQLSFLLLTLSQSEEHWWSWLLYGKDKQGQPLLADRPLTDEDLSRTQEKLKSSLPFKTKRYFNTHATPQLSRKMKTKTGLNLLVRDGSDSTDYATLIDDLSSKSEEAKQAGDSERERELFEERTVLHWKRLKEERLKQWLKLGESLDSDDIEMKRPVEKPVAKDSEDIDMEDAQGSEETAKETTESEVVEKDGKDAEQDDEKDGQEVHQESEDVETKAAEDAKETEEASAEEPQDIELKDDAGDELKNEVDELAEEKPEDVAEPTEATPAETQAPENGRELRKRTLSVDEEERPKRRRK